MNTDTLSALSNSVADAVAHAARFVVAVNGSSRLPASGVIWGEGLVVTAHHTLRRDDEITLIDPAGRTVNATLAGRDPGTDLAVLRAPGLSAVPFEFAPPDSLRAGSLVLAVGRRGENGPSASLGVLSALGGAWRTWRGGQIDRFVRADVSLYPGSSGSALIDADGRLIGVNTAGLTRGWSVTLPRETVESIVQAVVSQGRVKRGFLGVGLHPVRLPAGSGRDEASGLIVLSVEPGGPAAQAGLLIGDVLLSLDGHPTADTDDVQAQIGSAKVGKTVQARIHRGGSTLDLAIVVGERPQGAR